MPRRTKAEIEQLLLSGGKLDWAEAGKTASIQLASAEERRLASFLLGSHVRNPKGLPADFILGLKDTFDGGDDPAASMPSASASAAAAVSWRLARIETEGFGGINIWKGSTFAYGFDCESILIEGPNGSGKSSLVAAIVWCLSGQRPRDGGSAQSPQEAAPVFTSTGTTAGSWPPIACYPPDLKSISGTPSVWVKLTFRNGAGIEAHAERSLVGSTVKFTIDPSLTIPPVLLETGLLMPSRLGHIRFAANDGSLAEAVQMLTGLDTLAELGIFVSELCHGGREFLSYAKTSMRDFHNKQFETAVQQARDALTALGRAVPQFKPADTVDKNGPMAAFGRDLGDQAKNLLEVIAADLAPGLNLSLAADQQKVATAIDRAKEEVAQGIAGLPSWGTFQAIADALDDQATARLEAAILGARKSLEEATQLERLSIGDTKYRLKAMAASWHATHASGPIDNCPLCDHSLATNPDLSAQLEKLRSENETARRTFGDSVNAIVNEIEKVVPQTIRRHRSDASRLEPGRAYKDELRVRFVSAERYQQCLAGIAAFVDMTITTCPVDDLPASDAPSTAGLPEGSLRGLEAIASAERLVALARWARAVHPLWTKWWNDLAGVGQSPPPPTTLAQKLAQLDDAVRVSAPYRTAAKALRDAWKEGQTVAAIDIEQDKRQKIVDALSPLKSLKRLVDAEAKDAIDGLSSRMGKILERIHVVERLRFRSAHLERRAGITVRGGFTPDMTIDASLVANISWLRALLWAFLFSVREEAVEQLGTDRFPVLVFDDPQATFDTTHRHRWAQNVAALQKPPTSLQVVLATHDSPFAEELTVATVTGRRAQLAPAGPETGNLYVIEGSALNGAWTAVGATGTPKAARDYIADVRVHVESMLKLMMRGEIDPQTTVIGDLREKLRQLHESKVTPWSRPMFRVLVGLLNAPEIKHLESSHHSTGHMLALTHAQDVEKFWRTTLEPRLNNCFSSIREYRLMHGESKALHAAPPTAKYPPGHRDAVRSIPLQIHGRAAALTNGRIADGEMEMVEVSENERERIVLGHHDAFRIAYPRLEPVAREGDVLIVAEDENPPPGSLVVAVYADQLLVRRFQVSSDHPDVAVLTAQANNPKEIASPVIAHISTVKLRKVIGVLFDPHAVPVSAPPNCEVVDCGGDAAITKLKSGTFGLVQVVGDSAQPQALDGQFLLVRDAISPQDAFKTLDGMPVIVADSDNHQYFKRLRVVGTKGVVLESLDSAGAYPPIFLSMPGERGTTIDRVWPVAGVLFERPH